MTRVKLCGFTREEDVARACGLGADYIGFNFCPGSPRRLSLGEAARLRSAMTGGAKAAGVFADPEPESLARAVAAARLAAIQLHGGESPDFCARCRSMFPGVEIIRAVRVRSAADIPDAERMQADFVLLDGWSPLGLGGTGTPVDPGLLAELPVPAARFFIAGGLKPGNVAAVVRRWRPYAVDCASGIETAPGVKDWEAMASFIEESRICP